MNIKKQLNQELNAIVPPTLGGKQPQKQPEPRKPLSIKWKAIISSACAGVVALAATFAVFLAPQPAAGKIEYVAVDINPQITLVAVDGTIKHVVARNEDADVVLADGVQQKILGQSVAQGAAIFVEQSARLGYINLNQQGDIALSAESKTTLNAVYAAVSEYFIDQNAYIAVNRNAVNDQTLSSAITNESLTNEGFFARELGSLTSEEMGAHYRNQLAQGGLMTYLQTAVTEGLASVEARVQALNGLVEVNEQIVAHADNPAWLLKDYFTVKENYAEEISGEFAALMAQADGYYNQYLQADGEPLTSILEVEIQKDLLAAIPVDEIRELYQTFVDNMERMVSFLQSIGYLGEEQTLLQAFTATPTSVTDYIAQMRTVLTARAKGMQKRAQNAYSAYRENITREQYEAWMAQKNN